jgi:hypothetical protein
LWNPTAYTSRNVGVEVDTWSEFKVAGVVT